MQLLVQLRVESLKGILLFIFQVGASTFSWAAFLDNSLAGSDTPYTCILVPGAYYIFN